MSRVRVALTSCVVSLAVLLGLAVAPVNAKPTGLVTDTATGKAPAGLVVTSEVVPATADMPAGTEVVIHRSACWYDGAQCADWYDYGTTGEPNCLRTYRSTSQSAWYDAAGVRRWTGTVPAYPNKRCIRDLVAVRPFADRLIVVISGHGYRLWG